jgi:hypothetical protein
MIEEWQPGMSLLWLTFDLESDGAQGLDDVLALVEAHEAVVDVQCDHLLRPQRLVQQRRAHSGVHATTHQHLHVQTIAVTETFRVNSLRIIHKSQPTLSDTGICASIMLRNGASSDVGCKENFIPFCRTLYD